MLRVAILYDTPCNLVFFFSRYCGNPEYLTEEEESYMKNVLGVQEIEEFPEISKESLCVNQGRFWIRANINSSDWNSCKIYELQPIKESQNNTKDFKIASLITGDYIESDDFCFSGFSEFNQSPHFSFCKYPCDGRQPCLR